nr:MAG TPA: hypothetical protein [Caudoviricetes sp.]
MNKLFKSNRFNRGETGVEKTGKRSCITFLTHRVGRNK